jgi:ubiquinone/menaquinone biosynthesis C-methylase UbiE
VKGKEWYQTVDVVETYETKRFSQGGRLIDDREKRAVLDAIGPVNRKRVLEIACGTGRFTALLAERGADIVGLDISTPMLREGRAKVARAGGASNAEFIRGDAARLPFPDDYFDTVFAMRFFHLADTPVSFLSEMCRVSAEQVFFDTFKRLSTRSVYNWLLPMGSRLYRDGEVRRLLADAGLELANAEHDFALPYGLYRKLPNGLANDLRELDRSLGATPVGDYLASVSYWDAHVR